MNPGDQCPGCGAASCACTPADIRAALERDRAAMSDRLAASEMRANEWAALVRDLLVWIGTEADDACVLGQLGELRVRAAALGVALTERETAAMGVQP